MVWTLFRCLKRSHRPVRLNKCNDVASMKRTPATTFRSILCPVDFSTHSRAALRYAVATADRFGGRVTVMFVNDPLLLAAASRTSNGRRQFVERTRVELARFVKQTIATAPRTTNKIAIVVVAGNPAEEILRTAKRLRNDLIVIGTQGLSGFRKVFFGSTTEQILGRVTVPVLAIPPSSGCATRDDGCDGDSSGRRAARSRWGVAVRRGPCRECRRCVRCQIGARSRPGRGPDAAVAAVNDRPSRSPSPRSGSQGSGAREGKAQSRPRDDGPRARGKSCS